LGDRLREIQEIVVLRYEVGLAVHLDDRPGAAVTRHADRNDAFGRGAARRLRSLVAQANAQELLGLRQVPVRLDQRLLALHHGSVGSVAQLLDRARGDFRHRYCLISFEQIKKKGLPSPLFGSAATAHSSFPPGSSTSTNSSEAAPMISCTTWLRPSRIASAMPRAYSRIARLESSLPGIT